MRKQKVQRGLEGRTSKIAEGAPQSWNQRFSSPELGAGCCDYKARSLGLTEVVLAKGVSWAVLLKDPSPALPLPGHRSVDGRRCPVEEHGGKAGQAYSQPEGLLASTPHKWPLCSLFVGLQGSEKTT